MLRIDQAFEAGNVNLHHPQYRRTVGRCNALIHSLATAGPGSHYELLYRRCSTKNIKVSLAVAPSPNSAHGTPTSGPNEVCNVREAWKKEAPDERKWRVFV
ncbi:hypothetical protein PAAG_05540 [Paracoccidioides lutzii Pb01]|uniref:Uncharacterized protein n=1 Tax=Paracoccidioides lutzii (strain ATCC MYA-826 / Pb01) TaxID=502779 RepID=C1H447_PARBA|nr:hypothetical protein PAAG_05540 [Paracoccidioides lutzii Pb01]EEH34491.2 hypothetical protein PAAG_05540 [Paracoccidioides lutzii Pb01]